MKDSSEIEKIHDIPMVMGAGAFTPPTKGHAEIFKKMEQDAAVTGRQPLLAVSKGKSREEILITSYICHPSMANNELSGPIVSMSLINYFSKIKNLSKTLRFLFIPETIGSITYLSKNLSYLKANIIGGFNLSCIGDERQHSCMFSKYQNSPSDEAVIEAYKLLKIKNYKVYPFLKRGSDERQYNSPGIDLKISSIFRTKYGEYPEYHTSLDNFNLVTLKGCVGGFNVARKSIEIKEKSTQL